MVRNSANDACETGQLLYNGTHTLIYTCAYAHTLKTKLCVAQFVVDSSSLKSATSACSLPQKQKYTALRRSLMWWASITCWKEICKTAVPSRNRSSSQLCLVFCDFKRMFQVHKQQFIKANTDYWWCSRCWTKLPWQKWIFLTSFSSWWGI